MRKRTEAELSRAEMIDTIRTVVRLKHRTQMRRELNEYESQALEQFEQRVNAGLGFAVDAPALLAALEADDVE